MRCPNGYNLLTLLAKHKLHGIPAGSKAILMENDAYPRQLEQLRSHLSAKDAENYYAVQWCAPEHRKFDGYFYKGQFEVIAVLPNKKGGSV